VYGLGWFPVHHLLDFARIYGDTILGIVCPKNFTLFNQISHLAKLSIKLAISQTLKDNSEMFSMLLLVFGIDKDIIDKDHYKFVELRHEHGVNEVHEVGWGIRETKGHYHELVKTITSGEGSFRNVTRSNFDLMVTRTKGRSWRKLWLQPVDQKEHRFGEEDICS
jgi:hypothetical protein